MERIVQTGEQIETATTFCLEQFTKFILRIDEILNKIVNFGYDNVSKADVEFAKSVLKAFFEDISCLRDWRDHVFRVDEVDRVLQALQDRLDFLYPPPSVRRSEFITATKPTENDKSKIKETTTPKAYSGAGRLGIMELIADRTMQVPQTAEYQKRCRDMNENQREVPNAFENLKNLEECLLNIGDPIADRTLPQTESSALNDDHIKRTSSEYKHPCVDDKKSRKSDSDAQISVTEAGVQPSKMPLSEKKSAPFGHPNQGKLSIENEKKSLFNPLAKRNGLCSVSGGVFGNQLIAYENELNENWFVPKAPFSGSMHREKEDGRMRPKNRFRKNCWERTRCQTVPKTEAGINEKDLLLPNSNKHAKRFQRHCPIGVADRTDKAKLESVEGVEGQNAQNVVYKGSERTVINRRRGGRNGRGKGRTWRVRGISFGQNID